MEAKVDLVRYGPSNLLPLIIKETDPLYYPYLCSINDQVSGLLGRKPVSKGCKDPGILQSTGFDKDLLLFKQVYYDNDLHMYGTSHIRKLLVSLDRPEDIKKLDDLCKVSLERRRGEIHELLQKSKITSNFDIKLFSKIALNIWISPETFNVLLPFVKKIQRQLNKGIDRDVLIRQFAEEILKYEDYIINWGYFQLLFKYFKRSIWQQDEIIIEFIQNIVKDIRKSLILRIDYDLFASKVPGAEYKRIVKEGTLFYRGYRTYKGAIDLTRNHVWLTFDVVSSMNYLVPPVKEDSRRITTQTILFADSHDYCAGAGGVAVFRVKKDIEVLDFASVEAIKYFSNILKESAEEDVLKAFEHGWGIKDENIDRYSVDRYDFIVVDWLCKKNYGGYIAVGVKGLHDEILICNPSETLDYIGDYDPRKDMNFHVCQKPYTLMNTILLYM